MFWYQVHHLSVRGVSKKTLSREYHAGPDRITEQLEDWYSLEWENIVEDCTQALGRLVYKKKIDMNTTWNIFLSVTRDDIGPTT